MKIGVDISQLAYPNTGVSNYLTQLLLNLFNTDQKNSYVLFFSSFSAKTPALFNEFENVKVVSRKIPLAALEILWNRLHIFNIEKFIGEIDVFISSDWTEPPTERAKKATIIYDLIVYKNPDETDKKIVLTQKRKLNFVKKETDLVFAISDSTKKDIIDVLGIDKTKIKVVYPGIF